MMRCAMPIDLPGILPEGTSLEASDQRDLVIERAFHADAAVLRAAWTEPPLRNAWMELRRNARFTITHLTPACVQASITDTVYRVDLEACIHEDGPLVHLRICFKPAEPLTPGLLIAAGFADVWEERLYRLADLLVPDRTHCHEP